MKTLLVIDSSGRSARSVTRHLTNRFVAAWSKHYPDGEIIKRDVGLNPPPPINEAWIAAGFTRPAERTPAMWEALATSEALVDELFRATTVVVGAPMYNFGMPAQLKAYVDQIVRVGRTFAFNAEGSDPYQPLIPTKPMVIITSAGASGYEPGGPSSHMNFLEPHLEAVFRFVGLTDISVVRVGFEEFQDERFKQAMSVAERTVQETVDRLQLTAERSTRPDRIGGLQPIGIERAAIRN
jgi:FMN-dependent NADH-azoreductase